MLKNLTILGLSLLMCLSLLMRSEELMEQSAIPLPHEAEIRSVVAEYLQAVRSGDNTQLERLLHASVNMHEFVRYPPRLSYGFQSYDYDHLIDNTLGGFISWRTDEAPDMITLLGSTEMTASASIVGTRGTEYLQLVRGSDGWKIIQVLGMDPQRGSGAAVEAASLGLDHPRTHE